MNTPTDIALPQSRADAGAFSATSTDPDHLPLVRVWYGFMTARVTIALAILA